MFVYKCIYMCICVCVYKYKYFIIWIVCFSIFGSYCCIFKLLFDMYKTKRKDFIFVWIKEKIIIKQTITKTGHSGLLWNFCYYFKVEFLYYFKSYFLFWHNIVYLLKNNFKNLSIFSRVQILNHSHKNINTYKEDWS